MKSLPLHTFSDSDLEQLALTSRSYGQPNNERLEWLGDSILDHILSVKIYKEFPQANEGTLSTVREQLVSGSYLESVAKKIGLDKSVRMGNTQHTKPMSCAADALEAYIAAVYLDGGDVEALIQSLFTEGLQALKQTIQEAGVGSLKDAKSQLQQKLQADGKTLPVYQLKETIKKDNQSFFVMQCTIDNFIAEATQSSKKIAEQESAKKCLDYLLNNDS